MHSSTRSPHNTSHPPGTPHDLIPHDREAIVHIDSQRTDHRPARCRAMACNNPYCTDPRCGTRSRPFFYRVDAGPDLGDSEIEDLIDEAVEDFRYLFFLLQSLRTFFQSRLRCTSQPPWSSCPFVGRWLTPTLCVRARVCRVCGHCIILRCAVTGRCLSGVPEVGVETPTTRRRRCWVSISRLPMQLPSNVSALRLPRYFDAVPRVRTGSTVTPRSARRTGYTSVKSKANHMMRGSSRILLSCSPKVSRTVQQTPRDHA